MSSQVHDRRGTPAHQTPEGWSDVPPAAVFCLLAFAIAWTFWTACWLLAGNAAAAAWLEPLVILGSFGPFIAAGICKSASGGWRKAVGFFNRILEWRMGAGVFAISVLLVPLIAVATAAGLSTNGFDPQFQMTASELPMTYIWLLLLGGPIGEEFGWSYLSDLLDARMGVAKETLTVGVIWAAWHLPLFLLDIPGLSQRYLPLSVFLVLSVSMRILFSWSYHRGHRSILSNVLIHNALNLSLSLVPIVVTTPGSHQPRLWVLSLLAGAAGAGLWLLAPPDRASGARTAA